MRIKSLLIAVVLLAWLLPLAFAADTTTQPVKDRSYGSAHPLYFRMIFDKAGKQSMLGVLDESKGSGTGYDVAYIDENMNGDLTDEQAKKFRLFKRGRNAGKLEHQFEFQAPFKENQTTRYWIDAYGLDSLDRNPSREKACYFFWGLQYKGWSCFFINGKMNLFSSAAEALKGTPIQLGGEYKWAIKSHIEKGQFVITAALKDENGSTLRTTFGPRSSPTLTLLQNGTVKMKPTKMEFG